ncbi:hypothetical protein RchiOBHm_Chr7g0217651 [Rosa chinensis]|uniref:DUF908 domain-containing protein n=1 Tax=Rosa chinensis TaxID=74649 RepID=A0A2P6PC33_ROSCH|nr:hypothetical protein RchiOBHm_Chr7g0217651 [Rosa chinensis]
MGVPKVRRRAAAMQIILPVTDLIHIPDLHLLKEDDLKLMGQFIKDYRVPPEIWFSLLTRIRYSRAFRSPRTCKLGLLAFTVLVHTSDAPEELLSFFANEPDYINRSIRIVPSEVVSGTIRTNTMPLLKIMHQPSCPLHHIVSVSAST